MGRASHSHVRIVSLRFWFFGHTAIYFLFACALAYQVAKSRVPLPADVKKLRASLGTDPVQALMQLKENKKLRAEFLAASTGSAPPVQPAAPATAAGAGADAATAATSAATTTTTSTTDKPLTTPAQLQSKLGAALKTPEAILLFMTVVFAVDLIVSHHVAFPVVPATGQAQTVLSCVAFVRFPLSSSSDSRVCH